MKSTHNVCLVALLRAVLLLDDVGELVVVPVVHVVIFVALVLVEVPLRRLPLDRRVVRELALVALLAQPLLEEGAEHRLGVHSWRGERKQDYIMPKCGSSGIGMHLTHSCTSSKILTLGDLLHHDRLEEILSFFLQLLCLLFSLSLLGQF